jgi:diguanylate cyclase (GGDEF)-like protein
VTSISNAKLLLIVLLLQHILFGILWLAAAQLRLARRPALHWAAMTWLVAAGLALITLRGLAPQWLSVGVANCLVLSALVIMRRGIQRFARQPTTDREHGLLTGVGLLSALGTSLGDLGPLPAVLLAGLAMAWTLLRSAGEVRRALAAEFGRTAAWWCASPMALLAALFLVRAGAALLSPSGFQIYLQHPGGGSVAAAFVALFATLLLQANLTAMVLLRLVRRLQFQSDHDMLTGLLSRRPMEQMLFSESQRQQRFGRSFAVLSIDIDHFKKINDGFGHAAGDAVLKRVSDTLRACARDIDSVARMGGEEFCVLLPGADAAGAEKVALRMLETLRHLHHPESGGAPVTVSIGLAVKEDPAEPIPDLQRRLDKALYSAKAAGRDRIERAEVAAGAVRTLVKV